MYLPHKHRSVSDGEHFYVLTVISNPMRFKSRYELYGRFIKRMEKAGAKVITCELALGNRSHEVTEKGNPLHVQVRSDDILWVKENLIQVASRRLPEEAAYIAWIDADTQFTRDDWLEEAVHQLQIYNVIQLHSHAIDLGPNGEPLQTHQGWAYSYLNGVDPGPGSMGYYPTSGGGTYLHPGYNLAMRRDVWDGIGGVYENAIIGSGDHHFAWALMGEVERSMPGHLSDGYKKDLFALQERCEAHAKRHIGYVPGTITHDWHGPKRSRKYNDRWSIVEKHHYDPHLDLKHNIQGVLELSARGERMRKDLVAYFGQRNEDSIDRDD